MGQQILDVEDARARVRPGHPDILDHLANA